jgi:alkane 1-monooxygenase
MWRDAKYLIAYILPASTGVALMLKGPFSFSTVIVGFVCIPLIEQLLPTSSKNLAETEERDQLRKPFFDLLLYLNLPILYVLAGIYFLTITGVALKPFEIVGLTLSMGITVGTIGINVGHELGHRAKVFEQWMAQALLLPALYTHFFIEHNRGHHKNVGTDLDPASARKGQTVYNFWIQSVVGGYRNAWTLERDRLLKEGKPMLTLDNAMIRFTALQVCWLVALVGLFGWVVLPFSVAIAVVGFLLLETVNYIEHYGLRRARTASGNFDTVRPVHSWNSDHELGRIFLYELTRHSDHHYKANRKYQILRHFEESPQLPLGYPASILLALVPPFWFRHMNPRVEAVVGLSHS